MYVYIAEQASLSRHRQRKGCGALDYLRRICVEVDIVALLRRASVGRTHPGRLPTTTAFALARLAGISDDGTVHVRSCGGSNYCLHFTVTGW